jgi:hypothetical protein
VKKNILIAYSIIVCIGVSACGNNEYIEKESKGPTISNVVQRENEELKEKEDNSDEKAAVSLDIIRDIYSLQDAKVLYSIVNNSNETLQIVLAPQLDVKTDTGWKTVKCNTGFCGTPDPLNQKIDGEILLEWYPELVTGTYRLSFDLQEIKDGQVIQTALSHEFVLQ